MAYVYHYDIAAFIIVVTVFFHFCVKKTINTWQTRVFTMLIVLEIISSAIDVVTVYTISYPDLVPLWANYLINIVFLICINGSSATYFAYVAILTAKNNTLLKREKLFFYVPYTMDVVLIATTPFTKLVFYFDENGIYRHGPMFAFLYAVAYMYVIIALIKTIRRRNSLYKSQIICALFYSFSSLAALVVQIINGEILILQFAVAIAVLLIYLAMENPENFIDKQFDTFNNLAFSYYFTELAEKEKKFNILEVRIDGLKYINENLGIPVGNRLLKDFSEYLLLKTGRMKVFHIYGARFVIVGDNNKEKFDALIDYINEKFARPFSIDGMELSLTVSMCMMSYPDSVESLEDVMDLVDYPFEVSTAVDGNNVVYADKLILEKGRRENQIVSILTQAIRENGFEIFYQPIYSVKKERYTTAEALLRLKDQTMGYISPEEFIPIAEKNGLILDIGSVVFRNVCSFFKENHLEEYGIEYLHVNLSVVECMQERLHEKLLEVIDSFGLERKYISLEITETAAVASKSALRNNMTQLMEAGCRFAMDDYGTGFSNTATIINYPFSEIKIDKSMIWGAMKDEKAYVALKHSMRMIKELNIDVVAEGVETEEQANMLKELDCDFLQGYYFSKPVNQEAFLQLLR